MRVWFRKLLVSSLTACLLVGASLAASSPTSDQEAVRAPGPLAAAARRSGIDASVSKSHRDASTDGGAYAVDDRPCHSDADCTLTRVAPGECCPTLCAGRPVTRRRAQQLEANAQGCAQRHGGCPQPMCRPPESVTVPGCERGRCVAKTVGTSN
jgi:hypothetical protein